MWDQNSHWLQIEIQLLELYVDSLKSRKRHLWKYNSFNSACKFNDGLYIKLGQGMAASDHVLPPPFFKYMSRLQDKAKSVSFNQVKKVFETDVGKTIGECFKYFES